MDICDECFEFVACGAESLACVGMKRIEEAIATEAESGPARDGVGGVDHVGHRIGWI
jgi:hypothetical protein